MECKVCLDGYDDHEKRPRNLPCGHTFCSLCIEDLIGGGRSTCPNCRKEHGGSSVNDFPFAYDLEEMISRMKAVLPQKCHGSDKIEELQEERVASLNESLSKCTEVHSQLKKYQTSISQWIMDHDSLVTELRGLIEINSKVAEDLKREEEAVATYLKEGEETQQSLKWAKEELSGDQTLEVVQILDDAECCLNSAEDWVRKCQELIPNANVVYRSVKVRTATKNAMKMVTKEISEVMRSAVQIEDEGGAVSINMGEVLGSHDVRVEAMPNILQTLDNIVGMEPVTVDLLREMSPPVKMLVESGQVVAVLDVARRRTARISLHNGFICVHHLQDGHPPANSHILQHNELLRHVNTSSALVFLDVAWLGGPPCRLFIRLSPDTERGRQFRLLCTGEEGPSYANTKILKVINKGKPGECVKGGDYDKRDGTGGAALMVGLTRGGEYTRAENAGVVWGRWGDECRGAQFYITTRSRPGGVLLTVFGQVEMGLETFRLGIDSVQNMHLAVTDCGFVLPQ